MKELTRTGFDNNWFWGILAALLFTAILLAHLI